MGDSACLMHGFSYASSAIPNDSKNSNPMHALGESVSFGRFMTDSLSWEKWSTFSHKKYVEEAERYAQPGSVAEKKAFFDAHYKRIAAQKAAAAAALLEQQQNAANNLPTEEIGNNNCYDEGQIDMVMDEVNIQDLNGHGSIDVVEIGKDVENGVITANNEGSNENPFNKKSVNQLDNLENQGTVLASESRGISKQNSVANEDGFSSPIQSKTWEVPATPVKPVTCHLNKENCNIKSRSANKYSSLDSIDKKRSSPKSLSALMNLLPNYEPVEDPISVAKKSENLGTALGIPQQEWASTKGVSTYPAATPQSDKKWIKTPLDPSVQGNKTGPKWRILSAVCSKSFTACRKKLQSPTLSTPFILKTEERASKSKQEKQGNKFSKLGCSFCFKAPPSPNSYNERETPKNHMKKIPAAQTQTAVLGGNMSNETPQTKNLSKKNAPLNQRKLHALLLNEMITHENASPNIQQ